MPPSPSNSRVREQLLDALAPVVAAAGYDLEDVVVTAAGRRSLVRVVVDSDHGVDLDAVAEVSRAVSTALDDDSGAGSIVTGPFVLEVSSPGVDRPLTEPRHWRRATGRLVTVPIDGAPRTGRVLSADETSVTLELDGQERAIPLAALGPGRVEVEFSRSASGDTAGADVDDIEGTDDGNTDDGNTDDTDTDEAED